MKKTSIIAIIGICLLASCNGRKNGPTGNAAYTDGFTNQDKELIPMPKVPGMLSDEREKQLFILENYWKGLDWNDTTLIGSDALTGAFQKWMQGILWLPQTDAATVIGNIISNGHGHHTMQTELYGMVADVLNDPNSDMRNDELFLPVLKAYSTDSLIPGANRIRPTFLMEKLSMNRLGTIATDLTITRLDNGVATLGKLSGTPYIILYFFNPDCHDCERVSQILKTSPELRKLMDMNVVRIVAVYPDEDLESWNAHKNDVCPNGWTIGRLATETEREKYYLQAIPTLYLLDRDRRIILKDAPVETIIGTLTSQNRDDFQSELH